MTMVRFVRPLALALVATALCSGTPAMAAPELGTYHLGTTDRVGPQQRILAVVEPHIPEILRPILRRQLSGIPRGKSGGGRGGSSNFGANTLIPLVTAIDGSEMGLGFGRPKQDNTIGQSPDRNNLLAMVVVVYVTKPW